MQVVDLIIDLQMLDFRARVRRHHPGHPRGGRLSILLGLILMVLILGEVMGGDLGFRLLRNPMAVRSHILSG